MVLKKIKINKNLILILVIGLVFRILIQTQSDKFFIQDAKAYYEISESLQPINDLSHWYSWTPIHVIWLHITHRSIIIRILISLITVFILYKINEILGWIWTLYPMAIIFSATYLKENTLFLFTALVLWLYHYKSKYYILLFFVVILGFTGASLSYAIELKTGIMQNFWEIVKPNFVLYSNISSTLNYIFAVPYTILMIYYIRTARFTPIFCTIIIYLTVYSILYGTSRYREPLMMLIFYEISMFPNIKKQENKVL